MVEHTDDQDARFLAYLDGELDEATRRAFEDELARDAALATELARYERTLGVLRGLGAPSPPPHFVEAVEGRIRRRSHGRYFAVEPRTRLPYEAVAIVLLLLAMLSIFWSVGPSSEAPSRPVTAAREDPGSLIEELRALGEVDLLEDGLILTVPAERGGKVDVFLVMHPEIREESETRLEDPPRRRYHLRQTR